MADEAEKFCSPGSVGQCPSFCKNPQHIDGCNDISPVVLMCPSIPLSTLGLRSITWVISAFSLHLARALLSWKYMYVYGLFSIISDMSYDIVNTLKVIIENDKAIETFRFD